jgi:hypothetical protein
MVGHEMTRLAAFLCLFASPLAAQDVAYIGPPANAPERLSTVTLQPTDEPGAYAEVIFVNRDVNGSRDNGTYHVEIPGLAIEVNFRWSSAADAIEVITPDGFFAVPAIVEVAEGDSARVLIYSGEWLGG